MAHLSLYLFVCKCIACKMHYLAQLFGINNWSLQKRCVVMVIVVVLSIIAIVVATANIVAIEYVDKMYQRETKRQQRQQQQITRACDKHFHLIQ